MITRTFTDRGDGGHDGPAVRFTGEGDTVRVTVDAPEGVAMRRVDLRRLHDWLSRELGRES